MGEMTTIAKFYDDLVNALKTVIDEKYIYPSNRPNVGKSDTTMDRFVVIDLPDVISDIAIGNRNYLLHTSGIISLFVKSKRDNTLNVNTTSDFIDSVMRLFPVSGTYIAAVNPHLLMRGSDGYGYQVTEISFDLHTK